jgi:DNA polymerase III epsilon subunit-like protein
MIKIKNVKDYCLFDTETTGLDPKTNKILEYGCLRVRNNEIVDSFRALANHKVYIAPFLTEIHGIDNALIEKDGINPKEACKKALDFMGNDIIIGLNNIPFDYPFLEIEANSHGLPRPKIENWIDLGMLAKGVQLGNIYNETEYFYKYAWRIRDIRARGVKFSLNHLTQVYECENLREGGVHGAIVDLKMTYNIFKRFQAKYYLT